ncbi:MAG TPA: DsbA family protein [Caulobacteraceae bacterium]|jgi:protein-disulfide isomerase
MVRHLLSTAAVLAAAIALAATAPGATSWAQGDPAIVQHQDALLHGPASETLGNPKGDVTIIEFFDYACPYCKAAEPRLEDFLKADRNVRLVVEEFPILTPQSVVASRTALAAARQGKYAAFHQALMAYRGGLDEDAILGVARKVGLDMEKLRRDAADPALQAAIDANLKLARAIGAHGTPTFIVDGRILTQPSASISFPDLAAASRRAHKPA